jgi:hypothetical protein
MANSQPYFYAARSVCPWQPPPQKVIDFSGLPKNGALLPIPNGYGGMNWGNFDYITELLKSGTSEKLHCILTSNES